ncbi:hypothetical protein PLICRDRAFT_432696 [Plicaturopsis crispa FD-325 SS-3]|uniref:Uncharacterized protein n=1 Tax=Plicaturopsis crispa FD-325 SS-3 TaxID=944288 RepID=A0A0C9T3N8_PLICR|nr:hypothetical protein PLICRDRAFT_432696 [Plicaturopsis crispa FD-325 SS-3]
MQPEPARTFIPATADPETSGAGVYFSTVYGMDGEPMGVLGDIAADSSSIFSHPQRAQPISPIAGPSRSVSSHPPQAPPTHSHAKPRRRVWVGQVQRGWGLPAGARGKQFYAPGQEHQAKKRKGKGKEKMDPSQISTVRSYIGRKPPKIKPPTHDDDSSASEALSVSSCLTPLPEGYRDSPAPDYPEPAPDTGALTPWPNATLPENGLPNDVPVRGASEASSHISLETTEKGLQALAAEGVYGVTL